MAYSCTPYGECLLQLYSSKLRNRGGPRACALHQRGESGHAHFPPARVPGQAAETLCALTVSDTDLSGRGSEQMDSIGSGYGLPGRVLVSGGGGGAAALLQAPDRSRKR